MQTLVHWIGDDGADSQPFVHATSGTGQSGSVSVEGTQGLHLTGHRSVKVTQQTTSGDGQSDLYVNTTYPEAHTVVRCYVRFRLVTTSMNFLQWNCTVDDGTDRHYINWRYDSAYGVSEQLQYKDNAGSMQDSGLSWFFNSGYWHELEVAYDTSSGYVFGRHNEAVWTPASQMGQVSSNPTSPRLAAWLQLGGNTTALSAYYDELRIDTY